MKRTAASGNLRTIAISSFLAGFSLRIVRVVWQPFVLSLGAPMSTVGLLESIGGVRGVVTALTQHVGGWLSDRIGRKPFIVLGGLADLLSTALYIVAAITGNWRWLLPGVILLGLSLVSDPAKNSLVAESVHVNQRGMAFSILLTSWIAPGIFAPAIGGLVADRWGFAMAFLLCLWLSGLGSLLIVRLLRETLNQTEGHVSLNTLKEALGRIATPPRKLRGFYWTLAFDSFVWGLGHALLLGMLSETYGFTTFQLGVMSSLLSIVWVLSQLPIGRLIDRYGCKPFLVLSEVTGIVVAIGWLFSTSFPAFALSYAGFGLTASTWAPAQRAFLANSVPESQRGEAMGQLAAFRGLVSFPAPYLGGLLYERFGFQAPILANLVGVVVALAFILVAVKEPRPEVDEQQEDE